MHSGRKGQLQPWPVPTAGAPRGWGFGAVLQGRGPPRQPSQKPGPWVTWASTSAGESGRWRAQPGPAGRAPSAGQLLCPEGSSCSRGALGCLSSRSLPVTPAPFPAPATSLQGSFHPTLVWGAPPSLLTLWGAHPPGPSGELRLASSPTLVWPRAQGTPLLLPASPQILHTTGPPLRPPARHGSHAVMVVLVICPRGDRAPALGTGQLSLP